MGQDFPRGVLGGVRKIGTGCDAIFLNGPGMRRGAFRATITVTPVSDWTQDALGMLRQPGHAHLDGARRTLNGKPFVAAPGVNTKGVNRSAPDLFLVQFILN